MKVGIFGMGAYGMALSHILSQNDCDITMWSKFEEEKEQLRIERKNEKLLPGFVLSEKVKLTTIRGVLDFTEKDNPNLFPKTKFRKY